MLGPSATINETLLATRPISLSGRLFASDANADDFMGLGRFVTCSAKVR